MKKNKKPTNVIIYQAKNGAIELRGDFKRETIWATQAQIADVFNVDRSVVTKHIGNIFQNQEIDKKSNVQKMHIANSDKPIAFYSLDMILAIGYRANSQRAIEFRKWATKVLREHITKGFTINKNVIKNNYAEFQRAVENIKYLLPVNTNIDHATVLELISAFADTWLSLDAYDKDKFDFKGVTKKSVELTTENLLDVLLKFKTSLVKKGKTTDLFGKERQSGSINGIVASVMQSFGGKPLYPNIEGKAAHLLYFMVKNHPFIDGNKRSGAFSFIWFLKKAGISNLFNLTPAALTALTLFVAESNSKDKDRVVGLILTLLK